MRMGGSFYRAYSGFESGSVRTQNITVFNVKRILHRTGRMVCRDVQGLEIVKIVFDFRPVRHFETHSVKEFDHTLQGQGYGMQAAAFLSASGQGNVEGFGGKSGLQLGFVEGIAFGIKSRLKPVLHSLICAPMVLRSSGDICPKVFRSPVNSPVLPR